MLVETLFYCKLVLHNPPPEVVTALEWLVNQAVLPHEEQSAPPYLNSPFWRHPSRDLVVRYDETAELAGALDSLPVRAWADNIIKQRPPRLTHDGLIFTLLLASCAFDTGQNRLLLDWLRPYLDPEPHKVAARYTAAINTWYSVLSTGENLPYLGDHPYGSNKAQDQA